MNPFKKFWHKGNSEAEADKPDASEQRDPTILNPYYTQLGGGAVALLVVRDVTSEECPWLSDTVPANSVVFRFTQPTYGSCNLEDGIPVSELPDEYPFFELPRDAVVGEL